MSSKLPKFRQYKTDPDCEYFHSGINISKNHPLSLAADLHETILRRNPQSATLNRFKRPLSALVHLHEHKMKWSDRLWVLFTGKVPYTALNEFEEELTA